MVTLENPTAAAPLRSIDQPVASDPKTVSASRSTLSTMRLEQGQFDLNELSQHIETARLERKLTWTEISRQVGVATSTIRRFATAFDAEADGVLSLIGWLGVPPEQFVVHSNVNGSPLRAAGDGVIRVDMDRITQAESRRPARVGSRTTIQRLVAAAQASGTPVASLTKWCPV